MEFNLFKGKRGGRRPGSGRKRVHSKGVAHRKRELISSRTPLHINFCFRKSIRNKESLKILKRAILKARLRGMHVVHFSMQSNHIHLIVEASDNDTLTKGMRSLTVTFAKGLNQGRIQIQRYHLHVLRSLRETRNAAFYVLFNQQKHEKGICSSIDEYSSIFGKVNLIKQFLKRNKMVLKIAKGEKWTGPEPATWLLTIALSDQKASHTYG